MDFPCWSTDLLPVCPGREAAQSPIQTIGYASPVRFTDIPASSRAARPHSSSVQNTKADVWDAKGFAYNLCSDHRLFVAA